MKKYIVLAVLLTPTSSWAGTCSMLSEYAQVIMQSRQSGVDIADPLKEIIETDMPTSVRATAEGIVVGAYRRPLFSTEKYKNRAIIEYGNTVYLKCLEK